MKFENVSVANFEGAFRGLRNPLESWSKSDSKFGIGTCEDTLDFEMADLYCERDGLSVMEDHYDTVQSEYAEWIRENGILKWSEDFELFEYAYIGPKDLDLAHRMIKAGTSDRKFLRQIQVSVDITAPLFWFKEFDTYKIGTVANSTSTMHKLASTPITLDCFELNDYDSNLILYPSNGTDPNFTVHNMVNDIITYCETLRQKYLETKDKKYWKELIRWLPNGWLQTRTVTMNYEVLRNIYFQRLNHKLSEWHQFCRWVEKLPYSADLITYTGKETN